MPAASAGYVAQVKYMYQHQPDAVLSQVNPVSGVWYNVLPATDDVMCIDCASFVTWAVTQPNIKLRITIDGIIRVFSFVLPVSNAWYVPSLGAYASIANYDMLTENSTIPVYRGIGLMEGQNVAIDAQVNWAVTQPTLLYSRLIWSILLPT